MSSSKRPRQTFPLPALAALAAALLLAAPAPAADDVQRWIVVPEGWEGAYEFGYAPVVRVGNQVIVSGVPAAGEGTYEDKIRRMYQRAGELLAAAGATFDDVVELTTFHARSADSAAFREEFQIYMPIHKEFFGDHRPAWSAVGTSALLAPSAPVEMRLVAVVGSGENSTVVRGTMAGAAPAAADEEGTGPGADAPEPEGGDPAPGPDGGGAPRP